MRNSKAHSYLTLEERRRQKCKINILGPAMFIVSMYVTQRQILMGAKGVVVFPLGTKQRKSRCSRERESRNAIFSLLSIFYVTKSLQVLKLEEEPQVQYN